MIDFALVVIAGTLLAGAAAAVALRALPRVSLQLAGLALLAVVLPLGAVLLSGLVMFHMGADVKILAVAVLASSAAILVALWLGRSIAVRIEALRAASAELAAGNLAARAPTSGPAEVAELGAAFNEMAANVEELFDARRQLVAWASHDLRTPLSAMQAMLEAVEDGLVEADEYVPALHAQTRTLARLVDDLFELARIDANVLRLELRETALGDVIAACLRGLEAEARARGVRLESEVGEGVPDVVCAPEQVERVLLNLLTNALRHTPSDGSVAVVVRPAGAEVEVSVEDSGMGLAPDAERRMFDRFWRGDPARTSGSGGAGLGLAIAQGLVEAQGGRIWAENRPAGGARVSFTLPVAGRAPVAV